MTYEIVTDVDGSFHATDGLVSMSVLPERMQANLSRSQARLFKRMALKNAMTPSVRQVEWLVGELDGVRCYVRSDGLQLNIVLTRQDLYP